MTSKKMGRFLELFFILLAGICIRVMKFHRKENITVFFCLSGVISIKHDCVKSC